VRCALLLALTLPLAVSSCARRDDAQPAPRSASARLRDILLPARAHVTAARVRAGATMASLLRAHQVAEQEIASIVTKAGAIFDLRKFRADQPYRLDRQDDGAVRWFEYEIDADRLLRISRADDEVLPASGAPPESFVAEVKAIPKTRRESVVRGQIDRDHPSLFAAMDAAGETADLSVALADVFGGDIDFNTDLQPGDRFRLVVSKDYRDDGVALTTGEPSGDGPADGPDAADDGADAGGSPAQAFAGYGPIAAAELDNDGRRLRAVRFTPEGGAPAYYDEHGQSLRRFFLKSPLKFQPVITSAFTRSRFHPILREYRPHLGIDYRAPIGAPVVAVAEGVVVEAGMAGGAGRMVHLRHANGYETEYLHLSAIAVRAGARVHQGDIIGRVGMSGLATGPHLDYRVKQRGAFVNPLTAQRSMAPADPVPAAQIEAFAAVKARAFAALDEQR
jgi:murein DD-endopeptidase MepM/ murein hydrolase activator NlpD